MTRVVVRGGRLIDPANGIDGLHDLYIADGRVAAIGVAPDGFQAEHTVDATGRVVCPGLVDLRVRMREPGLEHKATIESETRAAVAAGITACGHPPDTDPTIDEPAMVQLLIGRAARMGLTAVHPLGALTRGLAGTELTDMAALRAAGCVGVGNATQAVRDTLVLRRAMQYASTFDLTVHSHPTDPWLQGNGCVHEGEVSTRLGLPAVPEATETVAVARDLALIETTGARLHFCQISTARAVAMIEEARESGFPVTVDVTAHHLHLSEHDIGAFNAQCHVQPPLRGRRDRDALRSGLTAGTIDAICSDHQPHEVDAKLKPFGESAAGISGLETLLPLTLQLVADGVLDLASALAKVTCGPARILGIEAGQLAPGARADVCVFDPHAQRVIDAGQFTSRGRNTPFGGWTLPGEVTHTLIGGRIAHGAESGNKN